MVEYVKLSCPGCQRALRVRKQYAGLEASCKHCGQGFLVPISDARAQAATLLIARPAADHEDAPEKQAEIERDRLAGELKQRSTETRELTAKLDAAEQSLASERVAWERNQQERDATVASLRQELDFARSNSANEMEATTAELERRRSREDELERTRGEQERIAACEAASLRDELSRLNARCRELEEAMHNDDRTVQSAPSQTQLDWTTTQAEDSTLATRIKSNEAERDGFAQRLQQIESDRADQERQHAAEIARLNASLMAAEHQRDALARRIPEQLDSTQQQVHDLTRQLQLSQAELEDLRSVVNSLGITMTS